MGSNFYLGLGCLANWSECQKINKELDRLAAKQLLGDPLTPAEKEWLKKWGPELEAAAEVEKKSWEDPFTKPLKALVWPVLIVGAAYFLIKGKIA